MPALILHGALQEELSGDVCVVCRMCFNEPYFFGENYSWVVSDAVFSFTSPENPQPVFSESKMRVCFLFSSCVVHFPSPRNRVCTFHPWCTFHFQTVETCSRHSFANTLNLEIILQRLWLHLVLTSVLGDLITSEKKKYRCDPMCLGPIIRCAGFVNGNRIQNKSFSLHNICVYCVYLLCIYKYTHIKIYFENIYMIYIYI